MTAFQTQAWSVNAADASGGRSTSVARIAVFWRALTRPIGLNRCLLPASARRCPPAGFLLSCGLPFSGSALTIKLFDLFFVPVPIAVDAHRLRQDAGCGPTINGSGDDVVPLAQHARRKLADSVEFVAHQDIPVSGGVPDLFDY